jgi:hypothetical protein
VLGEDLVLVRGQQDRMARGGDVWGNPVSYDKLGVRYRRWRNSGAQRLAWHRANSAGARLIWLKGCHEVTAPHGGGAGGGSTVWATSMLCPEAPHCPPRLARAVASGNAAARQQAESSLAQPLSAGEVFQPTSEATGSDAL